MEVMEWQSEWEEMMMVINRGDDENSSGMKTEWMRMIRDGSDGMTVNNKENDIKEEKAWWTRKRIEWNDERDVWQSTIKKMISKKRKHDE